MITDFGKYYLYRHIRLDTNQPFYIGIGTKNDIFKKSCYIRAYDKKGRNKLWQKIVNKNKGIYKIEILLESNDYNFIKEKEKEFIKLYGRVDLKTGILSNFTDGAEGSCNFNKKRRKKLSILAKNRDRSNYFKTILILDLNLKIINICKNSKEASLFIFNDEKFYKKITLNCKFGFKTNKKFFVIKEEDYKNNNINFKIKRKITKPCRNNCKSFYYNNKLYETKTMLQKELNISRRKFDKIFSSLIKLKLIIWKKNQ